MLTMVMYHYVRDLPRTQFPRIKGLLTSGFDGQLDYICRYYTVCSLAQVIAAMRGQVQLPKNACVLTFDDGLFDHYENVMPRLVERGLTGAFFPSARPIEEHCVLDVHKVQFTLAAVEDYDGLIRSLFSYIEPFRTRLGIPSEEELWEANSTANRFDPPKVSFLKRLLQWVLPDQIRSGATAHLFSRYVTNDEAAFARELYMSATQLKEMRAHGMEIGGHGYNHLWLGKSPREIQSAEIEKTANFVRSVSGGSATDWMMCYPFGSYDADTIELTSAAGAALGLTTKVGLTDLGKPYELPRLDTNDLPVNAEASVCNWTQLVA